MKTVACAILRREVEAVAPALAGDLPGGPGWDEIDARQHFGFYDGIVLLDFGLEPIDDLEVLEFFEYTQTPVEGRPADLDRFRGLLDGPSATGDPIDSPTAAGRS